jgi:pimeloyl-ACP methyl ester carboxylesterase
MLKTLRATILMSALVVSVPADDSSRPPAEAFTVFTQVPPPGPRVTPYLKYQTELAERQDETRRKLWDGIRDEKDLLRVQHELRRHLLTMLGGLPAERTPLRPRITGRVQMDGFHIEKLIFESLPGIYVTALVYLPDDNSQKHPAVLVPSGHSSNGKARYQALCQRLVQRGYVVLSWDPVGQGERSQFWDAQAGKSRYNLICAEHAVLGNLAYLAGTNLARWEIWDGVRAVDYLVSRPEVDPQRINITGSSGGGFQTAHIAALDQRIKVSAPSTYITALPMRVYNRIFRDPDSDPEQDLFGMISNGVDHPGLLLMVYPRPVFVAAAVLDFFPIEGTHKTVREVADLYARFHHGDRIAMAEGYHGHEYSSENQEAVFTFLDHFNQMPVRHGLPPVKELDDTTLQCTRTGQVMTDLPEARSLMAVIRDYYLEHKQQPATTLAKLYYGSQYPGIKLWGVSEYRGAAPDDNQIAWDAVGSSHYDDVVIDRYVLHHSRQLEIPVLHLHKAAVERRTILLWLGSSGKAAQDNWEELKKLLDAGYEIVSFDVRGMGETRMPYKAVSEDDPSLAQLDFDHAYVNPLSGVLSDYVYNSLLTGRPYFLQMMEDAEISMRFAAVKLNGGKFAVTGEGEAGTLARGIAATFPGVEQLSQPHTERFEWRDLVDEQRELWPIQYLLPGGAYIHLPEAR